jgi:hypothetical protein
VDDLFSSDELAKVQSAALHRPADHRLVAEVKAVEIAKRDDRAAQGFRDGLVEAKALHGFAA